MFSVAAELSELRTRVDWVFNPSVMMANALTAFVLNLVRIVSLLKPLQEISLIYGLPMLIGLRMHIHLPGRFLANRKDICSNDEHRGRDQGLDAHLLQLVCLQGPCNSA